MKRFAPLILLFWTVAYVSVASAQYLTSARLYLKLREFTQAEASAVKAVAKDDKDEEAWFVLGQARYWLRKYSEMVDAFNKSVALKPTYKEEIDKFRWTVWRDSHNSGITSYNKGRDTAWYYDKAIDSLKTAMLAMPESLYTTYVCALAYYGKKDYSESIKLLNTYITKDPKKTDAIRLLGQLYLQMGREKKDVKDEAGAMEEYKQAAGTFEKLYEAAPTNVDNIIALIDVYERAGMNEKALNLTSNCVKTDPTNRVCRFALGVYLLKKDQFAESIEQLKACLELAEILDGIKIGMSESEVMNAWGKPDGEIRTITEFGADNLWTYNNRPKVAKSIFLYFKQGTLKMWQTVDATDKVSATGQDEMYKDATYNLGVANLNWGVAMKEAADKKAEEERKAQKGKKKNVKETEDLSYKEKFRAAVPYLEKTAELRKDDATLYQQLGKLYAHLNMAKQAQAAFETSDKLLKGK